MDHYSRRIIGWSLGQNRKVSLTMKALKYALKKRQGSLGIIFHIDRGIEYASRRYRQRLKQAGIIQSLNRPGKMTDNAHMEPVINSFKSEVYHAVVFKIEAGLRTMLRRYLKFYNEKRLHLGLEYVSPIQYEAMAA